MSQQQAEEIRLRGYGISRGIGIGKPYFFLPVVSTISSQKVKGVLLQREIARYRRALQESQRDLERLKEQLTREQISDAVDLLEAQLQLIHDPELTADVEKEICESGRSADFVFQELFKRYQAQFSALEDPFFRERFKDLEDLFRRVMSHMASGKIQTLAQLPKGSVVFAHELVTSDTAEAPIDAISGFVTERAGITSHAAIVARARGIPFVTHIDPLAIERAGIDCVIIDGRTGDVICNPTPETIAHYREIQQQIVRSAEQLHKQRALRIETFDGHEVRLSANIEVPTDVEPLQAEKTVGIGLFRSEFLFFANSRFPSEEEQFHTYSTLLKQMCGLPVVIRVFDMGGDKVLPAHAGIPPESNPYLGWRAIRFLLREHDIFRAQIRAILRASVYGEVSILLPLVSGVQELLEAKRLVHEEWQYLHDEGVVLSHRVRLGCMIEVPSAAMIADILAKECDFLSIGTNDLVQYALAADRADPSLTNHETPTHPGVIRLIKLVVSEANRHQIPVSVCGEVAADPRYTPLLLGLGVHELSVATRYIPLIRNAVRQTSIVDATHLAERALSLQTSSEIFELLVQKYRSYASHDLF